MKLRDTLIKKLDAALVEFRREYKGGLRQTFATVETVVDGRKHQVTLLIQIEEDCTTNQARHENATLN
jgi:hypothetical protein